MRRFLLAGYFLLCCGCPPVPNYEGSVKVEITNGKVDKVELSINRNSMTFANREQLSTFIDHMESLLADLRNARDQMPALEPPLSKDKKP